MFKALIYTALINALISSVLAQDIAFERKDDKIYISAESCLQATETLTSLNKAFESDLARTNYSPSCKCSENSCQLDVSTLIPDRLKIIAGTFPKYNGPNCWNSVLYTKGLVNGFRFTSSKELNFWVNSPVCKEVSSSEELLAGDIGLVRSRQNGDEHGFLYLSDTLVLQKANAFNIFAFEFMSLSKQQRSALARRYPYHVNPKCVRREGKPLGVDARECPTWINYYRCQNINEFTENMPIKSELILDSYETLKKIEVELSKHYLSQNYTPIYTSIELGSEIKAQLRELVIIEKSKILSNLELTQTPSEIFYLEMLNTQTDALLDNL